ncbi:MAG: hypothetical protein O6945_11885 [Gammaproteobacteria bacterium]|nr:hypothetical protein [Gammaproteobacteria bacterium]
MKLTKLPTYWDAADAQLVISFLEDLRDLLVEAYGDEIIDMHQCMAENTLLAEGQTELPFTDLVEF